jgi:hypothetical protein
LPIFPELLLAPPLPWTRDQSETAKIDINDTMNNPFNSSDVSYYKIENHGFLGTQSYLDFGIKITFGDIIATLTIVAATVIVAEILPGSVH